MNNTDKIKDEAIKQIKCKMKIHAKMYEDGEITYEELHALQNKCMGDIKNINELSEDIKSGKYKSYVEY